MKIDLKYRFLLALLMIYVTSIWAQQDTIRVPYSVDFQFNDGIYLSFNQVKNNSPIGFNFVISNTQTEEAKFIENLLNQRYIFFFNEGKKQSVSIQEVWGYARHGVLYINVENRFFRLTSIGAIALFVANIEVERVSSSMDPWGYYGSNLYNERYKTNELKRFLLSFEDGTIYPYHYKNVASLLSKDTELFQEYSDLKRRKRKQLAIIYLKRYNKKHPLSFPVYQ